MLLFLITFLNVTWADICKRNHIDILLLHLVTYYIPVHISHYYNSVGLVELAQSIANWYQMAKSLLFDALNFLAGIKDDWHLTSPLLCHWLSLWILEQCAWTGNSLKSRKKEISKYLSHRPKYIKGICCK